MTLNSMLSFLGAAYLFGVATTVGILSLILIPVNGLPRSSCFLRTVILLCISGAVYLIISGFLGLT